MKLTFYGAAQAVTGSQHLLEVAGKRVLLDCGLCQGRRQESETLNREFPYDPGSLDAVVLSHAHIDHSGKLPGLVKNGFRGVIYSTSATRALASIMLPDSAHIQQADTAYINKKRAEKGLEPVEPLYDLEDALAAIEKFVSIPYGHTLELAPGVQLRLIEAGHILGSSQVEITATENGVRRVILYTGDLGRFDRPILRDPDLSSRPDLLITESTYGGRKHQPESEAKRILKDAVTSTVRRGGKVVIPAFSVGRTQEVLFFLNLLFMEEKLPDIPVFVDSPLSFNATEVFKLHPEVYDKELRTLLYSGNSPFEFDNLRFVQSVSESKSINTMNEPMVIISAAGMCENGRIRHHLKNTISSRSNSVILVGFMAENTLGRRIAERRKTVNIFGEPYELNAQIYSIDGFSAHADFDGLLRYWRTVGEKAVQVAVVHGEAGPAKALQQAITAESSADVFVPSRGDSVTVSGTT